MSFFFFRKKTPQAVTRSALAVICVLLLAAGWLVYCQVVASVRAAQGWELQLAQADGSRRLEVRVLRRLSAGVEYRLLTLAGDAGIYWWPLEEMDAASQQRVLDLPLSPPVLTPELRLETRTQLESLRMQIRELSHAIGAADERQAQELGAQRLALYRQVARLQEQVLIHPGEVTAADLEWLFGP